MDTPSSPTSSKSYTKIKRLTRNTKTISSALLERSFIIVSLRSKEDVKDLMSFSLGPHPSSHADIKSKRLSTTCILAPSKPATRQAGKLRSSTRFSFLRINTVRLLKWLETSKLHPSRSTIPAHLNLSIPLITPTMKLSTCKPFWPFGPSQSGFELLIKKS